MSNTAKSNSQSTNNIKLPDLDIVLIILLIVLIVLNFVFTDKQYLTGLNSVSLVTACVLGIYIGYKKFKNNKVKLTSPSS